METISFARGIPSPDILPVDELADCAGAAVARFGGAVLNYGAPAGYAPLREWIAQKHGVAPSRVVVTNGSLQAFNLVAEHVLRVGRGAVTEAPTYDRTLAALRRLGTPVESVPVLADGIDLDALAERPRRRDRPALVYVIPTFQNPTGRTLSLEKRAGLAALVAETGILLFEDDPYAAIRFEGEDLPTVHELADPDQVVLAGSFSKTVAPGLRLGYLVLPERLVAPVEALALASYVSPSTLVQAALFELLDRGRFDTVVGKIRAELRARRDAMLAALARDLPATCSWSEPEGGYFLWLELPAGVRADDLLARAIAAGVTFVPGREFYPGDGGEEEARLAYSFASPEEIEEGVRRLGRLVAEAVSGEELTPLPGTSRPARS